MENKISAERILAYIVDLIVIIIISFVVSIGFGILGFILFFIAPLMFLISTLVSLFIPLVYFYVTEYGFGRTVGHAIFGLAVTGYQNASLGNRLKRTLLKYPLIALIVFLYSLISDRYLHEEISGIKTQKI
ncbi:MAG: RDD family protein [Candidatus Micrarchaeota archaeon]|nr:RDD family protein [Candidatus Micrarchaeota archaeon]